MVSNQSQPIIFKIGFDSPIFLSNSVMLKKTSITEGNIVGATLVVALPTAERATTRVAPTIISVIALFLFTAFSTIANAQDTTETSVVFRPHAAPDSIDLKEDIPKKHSPKTAALKSLVPGWGQIYNKRYWKLPIIYGGFAGLTYSIIFNTREHRIYRNALKFRNDDDSLTIDPFPNLSETQLVSFKEYYRRNIDLTIIGFAALYALGIIDATVDAHLKGLSLIHI